MYGPHHTSLPQCILLNGKKVLFPQKSRSWKAGLCRQPEDVLCLRGGTWKSCKFLHRFGILTTAVRLLAQDVMRAAECAQPCHCSCQVTSRSWAVMRNNTHDIILLHKLFLLTTAQLTLLLGIVSFLQR